MNDKKEASKFFHCDFSKINSTDQSNIDGLHWKMIQLDCKVQEQKLCYGHERTHFTQKKNNTQNGDFS